MLDASNKAILMVGEGAILEADSKVMLDASNKAILVVSKGVISNTSGKVTLMVGSRIILIASNRAVLIRDELLAAGNKAGLKSKENEGLIALERPATIIGAAMPID